MTSPTPPPIGRVRLSDIAGDWSRSQALNPRLLAAEVAGVLRSVAPDGQPLEGHHYSLTMFDLATGAGGLTYWALADYFDALGSEQPSTSIQTTTGPTPAGTVLLAQTFVGRLVIDATQRAATAAGFIVEQLPGPTISGGAQRQTFQSEPPPGSAPEVLAAHQAQLRQEGEQSAGARLEAARLAQQKAEQEAEKAQTRATAAIQQLAALHHENGRLQGELNTSIRQLREAQDDACDLEAELEQLTLFAECLRHDNPLSPPELRLAFQCWCDLTQNGQHNPAGKGGRGVHGQVEAWVLAQGLDLNRDQLARLQAVVSWRKRGSGAIASH